MIKGENEFRNLSEEFNELLKFKKKKQEVDFYIHFLLLQTTEYDVSVPLLKELVEYLRNDTLLISFAEYTYQQAMKAYLNGPYTTEISEAFRSLKPKVFDSKAYIHFFSRQWQCQSLLV
jgi:hypothetical protein